MKIKLKVLGSGSSGNSYALIADNGEILAIEAGCKFMDFKKMIDWRISDVVGCIVSHEHGDHGKREHDALACTLYQIAQEIKPLLLRFGTAPSRNPTLTATAGMRTRGFG